MRGRKSALVLLLTDAELRQLRTWSRSTTTAVGLVRRADVILGVHRGDTIKDAAKNAGLSEVHARKWIKRFQEQRLPGLQDAARPGRPPVFSRRSLCTRRNWRVNAPTPVAARSACGTARRSPVSLSRQRPHPTSAPKPFAEC